MQIADLIVEVRDVNLARVGQLTLDDLADFTVNPRANDVGSWEVHLPQSTIDPTTGEWGEYALAKALRTEGAGLIVTGPNGVILSGPMTEAKFEATADEPDGVWTITGVSDDVVLSDALAFPDPATADGAAQTRDNDPRNAAAETLLLQYVSVNIGPSAPDGRRWDDLALTADQGRGPMVYASPRFDNLLTLLQTIATVGGLQFDVVQQGSGRVFRVWEPQDRSSLVRLDVDNDQLSTVDYGFGSPTATRVLVGGTGDHVTDRTIVSRTTSESLAAEAAWGRRIEGFLSDTSTADSSVLGSEGDAALAKDGATVRSTSITPSDDLAASFMVEWDLGDLVSVVVGTTPASAPVTGAILKHGDSGLLVGMTLGDPVGFDPDGVAYAKAQDTADRVSNLERSGSSTQAQQVDLSDYYTKEATDSLLGGKANDAGTVLGRSTSIGSTEDWNTFAAAGVYRVGASTLGPNSPAGAYGFGTLVVFASSNSVSQQYLSHGSNDVWIRTKWNASDWTPWTHLSEVGHTHAASDVTSGTLPIARGGTGAGDAASARAALGVPAASPIADVDWTDIGYVSGFSAGSANQLRFCVRNGVLYIEGGASGTFPSGAYTRVSDPIPSAYWPSRNIHYGAVSSGGRTAFMQLGPDGVITVAWNNLAASSSAPPWITGMLAVPLPA